MDERPPTEPLSTRVVARILAELREEVTKAGYRSALYHYTTSEGARGILDSRTIWSTDIPGCAEPRTRTSLERPRLRLWHDRAVGRIFAGVPAARFSFRQGVGARRNAQAFWGTLKLGVDRWRETPRGGVPG